MSDPITRVEITDAQGQRLLLERFINEDESEEIVLTVRDTEDITTFEAKLTRADFLAKIDELIGTE